MQSTPTDPRMDSSAVPASDPKAEGGGREEDPPSAGWSGPPPQRGWQADARIPFRGGGTRPGRRAPAGGGAKNSPARTRAAAGRGTKSRARSRAPAGRGTKSRARTRAPAGRGTKSLARGRAPAWGLWSTRGRSGDGLNRTPLPPSLRPGSMQGAEGNAPGCRVSPRGRLPPTEGMRALSRRLRWGGAEGGGGGGCSGPRLWPPISSSSPHRTPPAQAVVSAAP